uniref:Phospholipase n=1 Tax=Clastoptera arizonana TaxID=38151 RepID=A0A1B6CGW4_9HEMI
MSESGKINQDNGPTSLESEYDEFLDIPSDFQNTGVSIVNGDTSIKCESDGLQLSAVPFKAVHYDPVKFKAPQRQVFIPGQEIQLQFTAYERSVTTHFLNPNLYTIELRHGDFVWTLKKRYKHIQHLHQQLKLFRASLNIPFPTKSHKERRLSFKHETNKSKGKEKSSLPRFPSKPDALVPDEEIENRMKQLEEYLHNLLKINVYRDHYETVIFLEVSHLSFIHSLGVKGKEGAILKRTRSAHPSSAGCNLCGLLDSGVCVRCNFVCSDICGAWRNRWLVAKDTFLAYIRPKDGRVKCVILYDAGFEVSSGIFSTGLRRGLQIMNLSRQIVIKCPTRRITREWMIHIKEVAHNSDFTQRNRYSSFAPQREESSGTWFVDGCDYMSAVADALELAQEEIFIADWWLSPEIHMKRPAVEGDRWRLDKILQRKASEGVRVFVMLYKEVELALGINSFYSKHRLVTSHPNIKVLRHPDHAKAGVFLWAHHEKIVVIDQNIAFLGGIDLCYGRWDDYRHRLTDLGSISQSLSQVLPTSRRMTNSSRPNSTTNSSLLQLAKATNALGVSVVGMSNQNGRPEKPNFLPSLLESEIGADEVDKTDSIMNQPSPENMKGDTPEMERKNILTMVKENVKSKGRDFMTLLSLSTDESDSDDDKKEKASKDEVDDFLREEQKAQGIRGSQFTEDTMLGGESSDDMDSANELDGLSGNAKLWLGKDYTNFIVKDFNNLDMPYQDLVDRGTTPRMPWHDIGFMVQGAAARDVARHFIMRWNAVKLIKAKINISYPYLLPKAYREFIPPVEIPDTKMYRINTQIVRSVSHWSGGFMDVDTWEGSIHAAYVDVISKSQRYVYIENQFFISQASTLVKNQVADALFKRILRAFREGTTYKVFVVLPLLPGFEGEVGTPTGTALHAITHWNYASICRGKDSLMGRLIEAGITDPAEYISFHGLRTHSVLNGELVTELIYVHSKLLIADDRIIICGSANINDRSLLGKRDSEIAVVVQDETFKEIRKDGARILSGRCCGGLRRRLFREHLGLIEPAEDDPRIDLSDPSDNSFYHDVWRKTAQNNTDIYEKVFNCIPSNIAINFQTLKKYQETTPLCFAEPITAAKLLQDVRVIIINFKCN